MSPDCRRNVLAAALLFVATVLLVRVRSANRAMHVRHGFARVRIRAIRIWRRGGRINRSIDAEWEAARRDPHIQFRRLEAGRMRY